MFNVAVDIISAIEFDKSGDHLATGDRGVRVVLFERTDTKVRMWNSFGCVLYLSKFGVHLVHYLFYMDNH